MDEHCPRSHDSKHCNHWWDGDAPCCFCGDNTDPCPDPEATPPVDASAQGGE